MRYSKHWTLSSLTMMLKMLTALVLVLVSTINARHYLVKTEGR